MIIRAARPGTGLGMFGLAGAGFALAKAFVVSIALALVMLLMAVGFMYMLGPNTGFQPPGSVAVILVVFALSFVAAAVLLARAGAGQSASIVGGAAVALGFTAILVTIFYGATYASEGIIPKIVDWETLLTGFAGALVASVIINQLTLKL